MRSRSVSKAFLIVSAALAIAGGLAVPASATQVVLSGTHTKQEINSACDKVGGIRTEGQGGKGYGCYNPDNGALVACNNGGVCTGYTPRAIVHGKTASGILTEGIKPPLDNSGGGSPGNGGGAPAFY